MESLAASAVGGVQEVCNVDAEDGVTEDDVALISCVASTAWGEEDVDSAQTDLPRLCDLGNSDRPEYCYELLRQGTLVHCSVPTCHSVS